MLTIETIERTRGVEKEGILLVKEMLPPNHVHINGKSHRDVFLQRRFGDFLVWNNKQELTAAVEVKTERRFTGNLFVEVWSNFPEGAMGWLYTCNADYLWYVFLEGDRHYLIDWPKFRHWATKTGGLEKYQQKVQCQHTQKNETVGRIVPITAVRRNGFVLAESELGRGKELLAMAMEQRA